MQQAALHQVVLVLAVRRLFIACALVIRRFNAFNDIKAKFQGRILNRDSVQRCHRVVGVVRQVDCSVSFIADSDRVIRTGVQNGSDITRRELRRTPSGDLLRRGQR